MSEQPTPATTTPADPPVDDQPAASTAATEEAAAGGPDAEAAEPAEAPEEAWAAEPAEAPEEAEAFEPAPEEAGAAEPAEAPEEAEAAEPAEAPEEAEAAEPAEAPEEDAEAVPSAGRAQQDAAPDGPAATPRRRVTAAGGILAVLLALLGFTVVAQVRSVTDPSLPAARQEELVRILADLDAHEQRLRQEIAEQEQTLQRLTTAGESRQEALEEATRRADELGVLAGILPVEGPGLTVEIRAGPEPISAARLLDAVQELRGAGAEAIELTDGAGTQVRVVASSYFVDADGGAVRVDGQLLRNPYTITAIGEPATLRPALAIPGGVVESVHSDGGTVTLHEHPDGVEITAVREPAPLQYASPVS